MPFEERHPSAKEPSAPDQVEALGTEADDAHLLINAIYAPDRVSVCFGSRSKKFVKTISVAKFSFFCPLGGLGVVGYPRVSSFFFSPKCPLLVHVNVSP